MIFQSSKKQPVIRHPQGHPVVVIVSYNTVGDFVPRYFCIEDDNSELFKYQVSSIKATKDKLMVRAFYCTYDTECVRNDIVLIFDITKCRWVIG